jgi:nicotinamidase-related amidase
VENGQAVTSGAAPERASKVRAAVVAIDLHRGHLDMGVATMPAAPEVAARVLQANRRLIDWSRAQGIPVIHLVTRYRDADEIRINAFWRTRAEDPNNPRKNVMKHNIIGMPGCEVMPGLLDETAEAGGNDLVEVHADSVAAIDGGRISGKMGKEVFAEMFATGKGPTAIIQEKGLIRALGGTD